MLILSLLRHAKSSWKNPTIADHDRPLNTRGTAEAPVMGKAMAECVSKARALFKAADEAVRFAARAKRGQ